MSSFLDRFTPDQRRAFEAAGEVIPVTKGHYLLRRGDPGGDLYFLREGSYEVVDTRSTPEVILAVFEEGSMVGEMSFVDDSPRSADVRAATDGEVMRWTRDDLRQLLAAKPALAAAFYEGIARVAADRVRTLTTTAMTGGLVRPDQSSSAGLARVKEEARRIADVSKEAFLEIDARLRLDPNDPTTPVRLEQSLAKLSDEVRVLFASHADRESRQVATRMLGRELQPYLVRSSLAERCVRREAGVGGAAEVLTHVLIASPGGDGRLGELIDRWLLQRPMLQALRRYREPVLALARECLPKHRNRRVAILSAGTGSLIGDLANATAHPPTTLTVVDGSKEALAYLDAGLMVRPKAVDLRSVHADLAAIATGRASLDLPPQDFIVLQGLVEYMPERVAVSLLSECREVLAPGGVVVVCTLGPSDDRDLFDGLLNWPSIRRSPEVAQRILQSAGLTPEEVPLEAPALLLVGRLPGKGAAAK